MNDGNIRYYLEQEMAELKAKINIKTSHIEEYYSRIFDTEKDIKSLRVHYTSLLNTAIAYGYEVEEDGKDGE